MVSKSPGFNRKPAKFLEAWLGVMVQVPEFFWSSNGESDSYPVGSHVQYLKITLSKKTIKDTIDKEG